MDRSFSVTIKFDDNLGQVLVSGDMIDDWMNLGLAIEGVGVLMAIERGQEYSSAKLKGIKTREELTKYVVEYIQKVANDYDGSSKMYPMPTFEKKDEDI